MPSLPLAQIPLEVSIGGFAAVTFVYLVLVVGAMWLFKASGTRLIVVGLLTAIAAIGYSGLAGPAVVATPTLMKIAFLLVLGGIIVPLVVRGEPGRLEQATSGEAARD